MKRYFRQSAIKAFKTCPRQAWLDYMADGTGYSEWQDPTKVQSGARDVGTLVDLAYEAYYTGGDPLATLAMLYDEQVELCEGVLSPEWEKVYKLSRIMIEGYLDWVAETGADVGETTVACKLQLEMCVGTIRGDEVYVTGELDRLMRDDLTGALFVDDCKTVDAINDLRWLAVSDQLPTYCILAAQHMGEPVNRGRHTQLRKVLRTARSTPPFYDRSADFPFNETQLANHWTHMVATLDRMVEACQAIESDPEAHHRYAVPNATKDCTWRCDFLDICPMLDDGSYWRNSLGDLYVPRTLAKETDA